jgi:glycosyltransferase involved in cell wall biosynthesis
LNVFLFAIGAKDRASSRLRIWDHVAWLTESNAAVVADSLVPPAAQAGRAHIAWRALLRLPHWLWAFFRSDLVIVQEALVLWPLLYLKNLGKPRRVVFDFSDPVDRHGKGAKRALTQFAFDRMVSLADLTMVENKGYLRALDGKAKRLAHFYGPVNTSRYAEGRALVKAGRTGSDRIRIGWTGSKGTYPFIAPLMPIIDRIARDHPIEVVLIGVDSIDYDFRNATLSLIPWDEDSEFTIVPSFDLGLFRLEPTPDALWRGAGKLFIYMAAGVPFVASDQGIAHGVMAEADIGYRVAGDADWEAVLRRAAEDTEGRKRMSEQSATYACERLSYEVYRQTLLSCVDQKSGAAS